MCAEHRDEIEEQLSAYLDGQLTEPQAAEVERLLEGDPQLRRLLEELAATAEWVGRLPRESAPPGLRESTVAMLERDMLLGPPGGQPAVLPGRSHRVLRWLATAAVVAMACTAGYFTLDRASDDGAETTGPSPGPLVRLDEEEPPPGLERKKALSDEALYKTERQAPPARAHERRSRVTTEEGLGEAAEPPHKTDTLAVGQPGESWASKRPAAALGDASEPGERGAKPKLARADRSRSRAKGGGDVSAQLGQVSEAEMKVAATGKGEKDARLRTLQYGAQPEAKERDKKLGLLAAVPRPSAKPPQVPPPAPSGTAEQGPARWYPVRLDLQVADPAGMYALAGRARAFALVDHLEVLDVQPADEGEAATQPPTTVVSGLEPELAPQAAPQARDAKAERREVRRLVFRGRRSQLVRLLDELRLQDDDAGVQLVGEDNSVHRGWDQVASAAQRIGGLEVSAKGKSLPDFIALSLPGEERREAAPCTTGKKDRPRRAADEERSQVRGRGALPDQGPKPEEELLARTLTELGPGQNHAARGVAKPETAGRQAGSRQNAGETETQPAAGLTPPAPPPDEEEPGWVRELFDLLRRAEAALPPDPLVEVVLHVHAAPAATAPAPVQFEPAPELRIDRPREATEDEPPALGIDRREKD